MIPTGCPSLEDENGIVWRRLSRFCELKLFSFQALSPLHLEALPCQCRALENRSKGDISLKRLLHLI